MAFISTFKTIIFAVEILIIVIKYLWMENARDVVKDSMSITLANVLQNLTIVKWLICMENVKHVLKVVT